MALVAVGDNVVDRYPGLGAMFPGGNAYNVAVMAHRHGLATAYLGAVGTDAAGALLVDTLRDEGVDTHRLRVVEGPTATATVELANTDRVFVDSTTGVSFFALDDEDLDYIGQFPMAYSSYCSGMESQLADIASRAPLAFDFSDLRGSDYAGELLGHCTVAAFSASDLDEGATQDLITWASGHGPRHVVATRGARGAVYYDGTDFFHQPVDTVTAVDTLGAGDAFFARVLVGLARQERPDRFLPEAATAAAKVCTHHGALGYGHPIDHGSRPADHASTTDATTQDSLQ